MIDWPNVTMSGHQELGRKPEELQKSKCVLGSIPIIYYSVLLCVGVPVNVLTAVALSKLACRTKKALYYYLLAVTGSDILSQLFIIFVGFLLETAVFHREVPAPLLHFVSAAEFAANHASIWSTVPLTVDRYVALCHPLLHRQISYPARARKIIAVVLTLSLASGVPFFWWSDMWRNSHQPTELDTILIWTHVTIIYFLPCSIFLVLNSLIIHRRGSSSSLARKSLGQSWPASGGLGKPQACYWPSPPCSLCCGPPGPSWSSTTCMCPQFTETGASTWPMTCPTCWPCSTQLSTSSSTASSVNRSAALCGISCCSEGAHCIFAACSPSNRPPPMPPSLHCTVGPTSAHSETPPPCHHTGPKSPRDPGSPPLNPTHPLSHGP
uniref:G-protein coupled receptors family 1 profile domain-containing protein n=1 Tax=Monopterus albus TaxID=43700 RepID=A0A3Q3KCU6_MONAL